MKTLIIFIAGFALAILVLMSFRIDQAVERETKICHDCERDNFKEIPLADFYKDVARYNGTHVKAVTPGLTEVRGDKLAEPSRVCVYTLDTLKKFICFIETYSKAAGIPMKNLGINFFYAVYPKKKSFNGNNFGSLHTLYLTPTYYDDDSNQYIPFDIKALALFKMKNPLKPVSVRAFSLDSLRASSSDYTAFMMSASTFSNTTSSSTTTPLTSSPDGDVAINQGQLCPPACKGILVPSERASY